MADLRELELLVTPEIKRRYVKLVPEAACNAGPYGGDHLWLTGDAHCVFCGQPANA